MAPSFRSVLLSFLVLIGSVVLYMMMPWHPSNYVRHMLIDIMPPFEFPYHYGQAARRDNVLGIQLGRTHARVAVFRDDEVQIFNHTQGHTWIPYPAPIFLDEKPFVQNSSTNHATLQPQADNLEAILTETFYALFKISTTHLHHTPDRAVLALDSSLQNYTQVLQKAGAAANLTLLYTINDTTAANIAYGHRPLTERSNYCHPKPQYSIIYHLKENGSRVVVHKYHDESFEYDWEDVLWRGEVVVVVDDTLTSHLFNMSGGSTKTVEPSRVCGLFTTLLQKTTNPSITDIEDIHLIGPLPATTHLQALIASYCPDIPTPRTTHCPSGHQVPADEAIIRGVAIDAARWVKPDDDVDVSYYSVVPLSLGIEVEGGIYHVLMPRDYVIPRRTRGLFTYTANIDTITKRKSQNSLDIPMLKIYEGERPFVSQNRFLASIPLPLTHPAPSPQNGDGDGEEETQFEIKFEVNQCWILTVVVQNTHTKTEERSTMELEYLTEETAKMIADADTFREQDMTDLERIKMEILGQRENGLGWVEAEIGKRGGEWRIGGLRFVPEKQMTWDEKKMEFVDEDEYEALTQPRGCRDFFG